jgi:8-oxo-dGTP pyrophosphatase MutT (NUDIX family)
MIEETLHRPAARVICLDGVGSVLLLNWRDPSDGALMWEPPGGGIDPGETPLEAARRELVEETGLDPGAVGEEWLAVERDLRWNGRHFIGAESFFLARFAEVAPSLGRDGLLPDEQENLQGYAWVPLGDIESLPDKLEPPALADVIAALTGQSAAR